ncbi:phage antirepressor KilAC domain-containing protein [Bifidobacterium catenulatum]|uniref:phage antirepressor KilAC domain-containing protein n=1 Tax=Bifidobacterium catenulatum TaxID=1686 RepID=UPI00325B7182
MNNEIQKFDFKGAPLRTLTDKAEEPWFVAKDVCDILGTDTRDLHKILESDEITNVDSIHIAQNGGKAPLIISEPGLYRLVMKSRKPEAKEFQRWVTHEVLPQIRKTGGYIPTTDVDDDMTILAKAVMIGQRTMEEQKRRIAAQESHINELEPKARFADAVSASDGTCLIGELAKMLRQNGLDIDQNRLFEILRQDGYLGKTGSNRNVPTQKAMDLGLFRIKETAITHSDGHVTINRTAKVTGKGQTYFINRYCPPDDHE